MSRKSHAILICNPTPWRTDAGCAGVTAPRAMSYVGRRRCFVSGWWRRLRSKSWRSPPAPSTSRSRRCCRRKRASRCATTRAGVSTSTGKNNNPLKKHPLSLQNIFFLRDMLGMYNVHGSNAWVGMIRTKQEAISIMGPLNEVISIWV